VSRRDQIAMSAEEVDAFLGEQRVVTCATHGHDGWPHLMPLWYVVRDGTIWAWTYAKSQKVRNLERDPRATLQVEDGEAYAELRGVMVRAEVAIHRDTDEVARLGAEITARYAPEETNPDDLVELVRDQAAKRVGLEFVEAGERATWDHRKLAGTY
jgi:PPOX class probable F420-dependent enzyme